MEYGIQIMLNRKTAWSIEHLHCGSQALNRLVHNSIVIPNAKTLSVLLRCERYMDQTNKELYSGWVPSVWRGRVPSVSPGAT